MFPYPSGAGLHVGHPEGYTATDILCRYKRMRGFNVLHPMGWDAFGLPAEQYAVQTNTHPRITTAGEHRHLPSPDQVARVLVRLGPRDRHDRPGLLPVDAVDLPPALRHLVRPRLRLDRRPGSRAHGQGAADRRAADPGRRRPTPTAYRDARRLAYRAEVPVNWCPALGTVLANEEVIDGKSERGGHPVVRMPLRQWMLRITAYAERLADDLELVDWPRAIKEMQRNWIGRSEGAEVDFPIVDGLRIAGSRTRRRIAASPRRPATTSSASSPRVPTPSSAPPTWCWPPSIPWSIG